MSNYCFDNGHHQLGRQNEITTGEDFTEPRIETPWPEWAEQIPPEFVSIIAF
jgi:hypothetical protein